MKAYLAEIVRGAGNPLQARHLAREYLQARILASLQRVGAMMPLAFHGGTALRFLYAIPRYSEGLDFALERRPEQYDFRAYLKAIQADLAAEAYATDLKINDRKPVHSAFVRFRDLLYPLELTSQRGEVLSIKIEVDTRPPAGATLSTTLIRRHFTLNLQHHDQASLLAGKLHAILQRPFTKGRDLYDLFWYLSPPDWPKPNLTLLNSALAQTGWAEEPLTETSWRPRVVQKLDTINWEQAVADAWPFLMRTEELALLNRENLLRLLKSL